MTPKTPDQLASIAAAWAAKAEQTGTSFDQAMAAMVPSVHRDRPKYGYEINGVDYELDTGPAYEYPADYDLPEFDYIATAYANWFTAEQQDRAAASEAFTAAVRRDCPRALDL